MNGLAYQGIEGFVLSSIHAGEWGEGDQVPSENALAREFNFAGMAVNRAKRELTSEQVVKRVQLSGTFVACPKYEATQVVIRSISDEIVRTRSSFARERAAARRDDCRRSARRRYVGERGKPGVLFARADFRKNDEPVQLEGRWSIRRSRPSMHCRTSPTPRRIRVWCAFRRCSVSDTGSKRCRRRGYVSVADDG